MEYKIMKIVVNMMENKAKIIRVSTNLMVEYGSFPLEKRSAGILYHRSVLFASISKSEAIYDIAGNMTIRAKPTPLQMGCIL